MIKSILAMLAFAVVASVSAQAITLEEIIANNIEARGGYDKLKALKSLKVTGTMQTMGGEMEFTSYFKDNSKMRMNMNVQGQEIVQAFDGFVAWSVNPFMGGGQATKLPKDQNDRFAAQSDIAGEFVDHEDKGLKLEFEGAVDIDGMTAYKVNITNANRCKYQGLWCVRSATSSREHTEDSCSLLFDNVVGL